MRCDRCGTRFRKAGGRNTGRVPAPNAGEPKRERDDVDGLGIHPALAKKYRDRNSMPPTEQAAPPAAAADTAPVETRDTAPESLAPPSPGTRVLVDDDPGTTNPGRKSPLHTPSR